VRELRLMRAGRLAWHEREPPRIEDESDAIVRPFLAGRCDGDTLPIHRPVSRALQAGMALRLVDPVVRCICGKVPFKGPVAIGHECVAQIIAVGRDVARVSVGQTVVVPWAVSCGTCARCRQGLTSKCERTSDGRELAAFGFGPASGPWGRHGRRHAAHPVRRSHARARAVEFAGARNVFLRVGSGRIHLYDQPPKTTDRGALHHLGVVSDELEHVVERLRALGHSVTDIRREPTAAYAMAEGPDRLLVEIFQPDPTTIAPELRAYFQGDHHADAGAHLPPR
jgi:alcohol dehydrogenase-like protein